MLRMFYCSCSAIFVWSWKHDLCGWNCQYFAVKLIFMIFVFDRLYPTVSVYYHIKARTYKRKQPCVLEHCWKNYIRKKSPSSVEMFAVWLWGERRANGFFMLEMRVTVYITTILECKLLVFVLWLSLWWFLWW